MSRYPKEQAKNRQVEMLKGIVCLFLILGAGCESQSRLPEPYNRLKTVLPFDNHGWYMNGGAMKKLLKDHNVRVVIEVGSWLGQSTRHIAKHLPKNGKVYAVDHWQGSVEHQAQKWSQNLPSLYEQFLSNVIHAKLTDKIIPVRMASVDAEKHLSTVIPDLIYIDAGHETEAVYQDLTIWFPHVKGHGILCGDDWCWSTVRQAVEKFALENNLGIETQDTFWRLIERRNS